MRNGVCEDDGASCSEGEDCTDCGPRELPPLRTGTKAQRAARRATLRHWSAAELDICLCTIATVDRIASLHRLAQSWEWLMSVAYLAEPGQFERDSSMPADELLHFPPHMDKLTLTVVEDRNYRAPRNRFPLNLLLERVQVRHTARDARRDRQLMLSPRQSELGVLVRV